LQTQTYALKEQEVGLEARQGRLEAELADLACKVRGCLLIVSSSSCATSSRILPVTCHKARRRCGAEWCKGRSRWMASALRCRRLAWQGSIMYV
jgi:hypothetical protein